MQLKTDTAKHYRVTALQTVLGRNSEAGEEKHESGLRRWRAESKFSIANRVSGRVERKGLSQDAQKPQWTHFQTDESQDSSLRKTTD